MIDIRSVSKNWKNFQLKNINLNINRGEYFVILGPTGAGKTLFLETLAGFHYPDSGGISLDGMDVTFAAPEKRGVGFVYQDYMLFPHMDVFHNIAYGLKKSRADAESSIEKIAALLGISHLLRRDVRTLSGGEQQRVALARALVIEPKILLMDEPLGALDVPTQRTIRRELKKIMKELAITTLHVTHDREEAITLADRIGVMHEGAIMQVGTPDEVFRRPVSEFVANFVGAENIFLGDATESGDTTVIKIGDIDVRSAETASGSVHAAVRPEDIIVSRESIKSSARNVFCGKVTEISDHGTVIHLGVDVRGKRFTVFVTRQSFEELGIAAGAEVFIAFKASSVHVF